MKGGDDMDIHNVIIFICAYIILYVSMMWRHTIYDVMEIENKLDRLERRINESRRLHRDH